MSVPSDIAGSENLSDHAEGREGVILFDGICNFCNAAVNFVIDRDPNAYFAFGALQWESAISYCEACETSAVELNTLVLIENGACYTRSSAALRIARRLTGGWPLLYVFILIPRPLRDSVYDFVAARRYRWFGKLDSCRIPTPELESRFLPETV